MDKLTIVYAVLASLFGLLLILRQMKVANNKDLDDIQSKEVLDKDIKEINFNTSSERFFREHNFDKEKYRKFFKYGYTVYHHSLEYDMPFKKSYGSELLIEYSDVKITEPTGDKTWHTLEFKTHFKNLPGNSNIIDSLMGYRVWINIEYVDKIQILYGIGDYGQPQYKLVDCFVLLNYDKPYTYIVGPKDSSFFKKR